MIETISPDDAAARRALTEGKRRFDGCKGSFPGHDLRDSGEGTSKCL